METIIIAKVICGAIVAIGVTSLIGILTLAAIDPGVK